MKSRILVTNSVAYLSQTSQLLLMRGGIILENDTYYNAMANPESELYKFMYAFDSCDINHEYTDNCRNVSTRSEPTSGRQSGAATPRTPKETSLDDVKTEITLMHSAGPTSKTISPTSSFSKAVKSDVVIAAPEADKAKKEHRERGQVKAEVYKQYVLAGGIGAFILLACSAIVGQAVNIGEKTYGGSSVVAHFL